MNVNIENIIYKWDNETSDVVLNFLNMLNMVNTKSELEQELVRHPYKEQFKKNFQWGFGSHHFWANQVCPYNGHAVNKRLLMVEL